MEKLKKQRTLARSNFTRVASQLDKLLLSEREDSINVNSTWELVKMRFVELESATEAVYSMMLENDESTESLEQEASDADKYYLKYNSLLIKINQLETNLTSLNQASDVQSCTSNIVRKTIKLPTLELKKFNGELKEWLPFWSQFQKIDDDTTLDDSDKFQYLIQCMVKGSKPRELVESYPATAGNYCKAINSLKCRYGNQELLIEVYIRELLQLIIKNVNNKQESLSSLYDHLECHLRSLETLGITTDVSSAMLLPLIESALPMQILQAWQRAERRIVKDENECSSKTRLENLMDFVKGEVESELKLNLAMTGLGIQNHMNAPKRPASNIRTQPTASVLLTQNKATCIFCSGDHKNAKCRNANKLNLEQRRELVKRYRSCFICLCTGHLALNCRDKSNCTICGRRHHDLICDQNQYYRKQKELKNQSTVTETLTNLTSCSEILLQTLLVRVSGEGKERTARAIIDSASQRSYISKQLAREMNYESQGSETLHHSLFGGVKMSVSSHDIYKIHLTNMDDSYSCNFDVLSQTTICGDIPPVPGGPWRNELEKVGIKLTDLSTGPIEILIGANVAGRLFTGNKMVLSCGLVAMETFLGWTVMGRCGINDCVRADGSSALMTVTMLASSPSIQDLWSLDVLGIEEPSERRKKAELQEAALKHFHDTVTRDGDGRYVVNLPWLENHPPLSNNYNLSLNRLNYLVKKLDKDGYYKQYQEVLMEWENEGIIEEVPISDINKIGHYLPHRHVIKENSTTKLRPVFDASAHESKQPSLNNCVEKGPNLIELISAIINRFRFERFGIVADIKRAFLQIRISQKDTDFLRFLWKDYDTRQLKIYKHCRVVFGVACSPFLLGAVIRFHLDYIMNECDTNGYEYEVIQRLRRSLYVDNCVISLSNLEEVENFVNHSVRILKEGKFELRGWEYSGENGICKVLGLSWDKKEDVLFVEFNDLLKEYNETRIITKRFVLSVAHRLFDPIGLICCVTLVPKLLLQKAWSLKLSWDQSLPEDLRKLFLGWWKKLKWLSDVRIPRWLGTSSNCTRDSCSFHIFCDASQMGYAAVIFTRIDTGNEVVVQLVQARARVAPVGKNKSKITIPRLELLAATVGARLYHTVCKDLESENVSAVFWSDSSTVLAWIERNENWDMFVSNRVKEIRELVGENEWKYVPGVYNPADLPSRGCSAKKLVETRWWEGPSWLKDSPSTWLFVQPPHDEYEIGLEKRKIVVNMLSKVEGGWYYKYFSKFSKIIRMVAWMKRFIHNTKKGLEKFQGRLDVREIEEAEITVLRMVQLESFTGLNDRSLIELSPFYDETGLMRVKTAVVEAIDSKNFRYPVLLPGKHEVVQRLIFEKHIELCHIGVQGLLGIMRERYWLTGGRRNVKSVIRRCVVCRRYNLKQIKVEHPPLPLNRIKEAAAFEVTGVDLAGPVYLKGQGKAWICLYTCAVYRAVHIELVSSMSTSSFIQSLRRFIARRGRPCIIYSDNGRNFKGADNLFKELNWDEIHTYSVTQRIRWLFNPPSAAWWGGWWERIIGLLKQILRKVLGRASLNFEELYTILCDCESVLNARPLTYISDNTKDLVPLTPSMFIQGIRENGVPDCDDMDSKALNRRVRYRTSLSLQLRRRFRQEYLGALTRKGSNKKAPHLKVGDIVLLGSDDKKRLDWPLAIIEEGCTGVDGVTRLYRLSTSSGEVLRPIQRLYPLEASVDYDVPLETQEENSKLTFGKQQENKTECVTSFKSTRSGRQVKLPKKFIE